MLDINILTLIKIALAEDIGSGDATSRAFIPETMRSCGRIITRNRAVVAGLAVAVEVFQQLDPTIKITLRSAEGELLEAGATLLELAGPTRSLLAGERVALNFLGRLTGIATLTRAHVDAVEGTGVTILDTRKMTPGWRTLEKAAVQAGGGKNHRVGLFDAILIKDNHLAALDFFRNSTSAVNCGVVPVLAPSSTSCTLSCCAPSAPGTSSAEASLERSLSDEDVCLPARLREVRVRYPEIKIEIEADTLEQASFFLEQKEINTILLDNMSLEELCAVVVLRNKKAPTIRLEASGGITLANLRAVAETGIDEISLGALTHSAPWADLSLEFTHD